MNEPLLGDREAAYVNECLRTGWISSEGPFVERFEQAMAERCQRRFGVAVSNGSVALDLAVHALGIGPGDEVIIPTFTIISCAAAVVRAGAVPVTVDCDPDTWNMTTDGVACAITSRTRAIMLVHIYGLPVDLDPILTIAERHGLAVIEDAAEMHGQTYRGRPCGSVGNLSTLSFYANKHVTSGEGGMVLTDDEALARKLRAASNLYFQPERRFVHEELGWNGRLTNLQAALGLAQVERLDESIARKRAMGRRYNECLIGTAGLILPVAQTEYAENVYWVYGVVLGDNVPVAADEVMSALGRAGIGTRPFFWCMHEQPVFRKQGLFDKQCHPNAERIARRGFYLPSGMALTPEQIDTSARSLRETLDDHV